ncbi:helix-turn-helix domain-containing protein [Halobacteria archaeon AArc-curdl1]|uniref:Helix-turn-helix domain-containing protein n=1 Tax=Natronosalvus hydrolyticus TaxID=2979988 RepID=A0AAP3E6B1_9EURY|nr:helix-turn-helix domain-containing protein [Halobacteria archaeon AArc-curdl1]
MATIATFQLPLEGFPLGVGIAGDRSIRVELERVVPTEGVNIPFFWVWNCTDFDAFERRVRDTDAVQSVTVLTEAEDGRLYRARWSDAVEGFLSGITELGATLLNGAGTRDGWRFELRFDERSTVRTFLEYCQEQAVPVELTRLYTPQEASARDRYSLTDEQRETIRLAYERGYFDEPREITQAQLAEAFDISQRAVSRRLQRGLSRLIAETIAVDADSSER